MQGDDLFMMLVMALETLWNTVSKTHLCGELHAETHIPHAERDACIPRPLEARFHPIQKEASETAARIKNAEVVQ